MIEDKTDKIVAYDKDGKALWVQYPNAFSWLHKPFHKVLEEDLGITLTEENIKQLKAKRDTMPIPTFNLFYDLYGLCNGMSDYDLCVRSYLTYPKLGIRNLREFIYKFDKPEIPKSAFKLLLAEFDLCRDLDKLEYKVNNTSYDIIIEQKLTEHVDKIASFTDKEKLTNWLIGQVMKEIKDKKGVDIQGIKNSIMEKI